MADIKLFNINGKAKEYPSGSRKHSFRRLLDCIG